MRDFLAGPLWGSSTAAHQVEGGNVNNYLESHLAMVKRALDEGYRPTFGLVGIDRERGLARVASSGRLADLRSV